jgi:diacylglycerol kinase
LLKQKVAKQQNFAQSGHAVWHKNQLSCLLGSFRSVAAIYFFVMSMVMTLILGWLNTAKQTFIDFFEMSGEREVTVKTGKPH